MSPATGVFGHQSPPAASLCHLQPCLYSYRKEVCHQLGWADEKKHSPGYPKVKPWAGNGWMGRITFWGGGGGKGG